MTTTHRKIDLQSPADLTHLHNLARDAATQKLNTTFPVQQPSSPAKLTGKVAAEEDPLRARVQQLLSAFVDGTYFGVRRNVCVNGVELNDDAITASNNVGGIDAELYEDFDARLAEKIREMEARKEELVERVADLRRTGGTRGAEIWKCEWENRLREVDAKEVEEDEAEMEVDVPNILNIAQLRRWDDVQATHTSALEELVKLKSGMGATAATLVEAKKISEVLMKLR